MCLSVMILYLLTLLPAKEHAQNKDTPTKQREGLATVSIVAVKRSFKLGEPIAFTVLLTAGEEGVYVEKGWSQAGAAIPGFYVDLETANGGRVQTCRTIVDGMPNEDPDPQTILARAFILLRQGEVIGWSTTIECPPHKRGKYRVRASYSPDRPLNERIAGLKETRGRVVVNVLDAKPMDILIR